MAKEENTAPGFSSLYNLVFSLCAHFTIMGTFLTIDYLYGTNLYETTDKMFECTFGVFIMRKLFLFIPIYLLVTFHMTPLVTAKQHFIRALISQWCYVLLLHGLKTTV
jgi:hypothetical protein